MYVRMYLLLPKVVPVAPVGRRFFVKRILFLSIQSVIVFLPPVSPILNLTRGFSPGHPQLSRVFEMGPDPSMTVDSMHINFLR
ncbi:hypothetical protein K445DRAFT_206316 [Daldinia sp. EC12]|nr:hypothetical protein F4774DRAFT_200574 [Daldinia eschscholtzii]OTB11887.1 hypothetical protein K445DRAFT_206316 [Daldinia sp. EC12]